MRLEHYFITLIDLPEILPFTMTTIEEKFEENLSEQEKSSKKLFEFVNALEKNFDQIHYIGQDNIEGKFYQRFLFKRNGFMEIMQTAPAAIIAHFSKEKEAQKFVKALKEVVEKFAMDKRAAKLLIQDIKVQKEEEESLTYETWSKLKNIRKSLNL